jgi:phosphatidylglycerophosphatase A
MTNEPSTKPSAITRLTVVLGTGLGLGCSPFAPGTVGALLGIPLVWGCRQAGGWEAQSILALGLALLAIPICGRTEMVFGRKDDRRIVADEYLTFPICMLGLPFNPWMVAFAFLSNRLCDILKPPPAAGLQRLKGGTGVVVDDVIAALYSLAINHVAFYLSRSWLS